MEDEAVRVRPPVRSRMSASAQGFEFSVLRHPDHDQEGAPPARQRALKARAGEILEGRHLRLPRGPQGQMGL